MQKIRTYIGLFIITILVSFSANSQTYNFSNYNVADGLEQSDILAISQATNGYLLYGSNGGGLGIYDGYSFKSIKEKHGLSNNVVFSIDIAKSDEVWVATYAGASLVNSKVTKVIANYAEGVPFYCVKTNRNNGDVWLGSSKGIYTYDKNKDSLVAYKTQDEALNNTAVTCLNIDSENRLWVGTKTSGLFVVEENGKVTNYTDKQGLSSNWVITIIEGKPGEIFAGTFDGLNLVKNNNVNSIDLPKVEGTYITFKSSTYYKNKLVFGAYNNVLYFLDKENYEITMLDQNNGFLHKKIWSIYTDSESNLWLGSVGSGLIKYNPIFTFYNQSNGLISGNIKSVYKFDNRLFVGFSGGLNIIEKNAVKKTLTSNDLGFSNVNHINSYNGNVILGTNKGLFKFIDDKPFLYHFFDKEKVNENIWSTCSNKNKLYVGGGTGAYVLKNDSLFSIPNSPKEAIYDIVNFKGGLYLASNKGIYKYDNNQFEFLSKEQGLVCDRARSFRIDSKNNLWIATSEGAYLYNGKIFKKIDELSGLTSENIYLIELEGKGNIWLGSNKGLDRVNIESVYQHWNNPKANKIEVRNYGKNEGFNGVECNLNAVHRNKQNQLYFGTINGLYIYHSENDKINKEAPVLTLNNIKLNFENVEWENYSDSIDTESGIPTELELEYDDNNLIFEYVGVSLTNPNDVQYQHKLEGLNEEWLPLTKDRKAVYTAIPHGDYVFKLKAKNSDGVWVENETVFSFSIMPPWWQTTWFYITVVLFVLILGYTIIVVRTRNLKKAQIVLTSKVEERTKELREEKEKVESVNIELADQKKVIEVANKNITDSINYAKKIQEALLPKAAKLEELKDSVSVLYMPKDVVSGDFYWFERVGNKLIFAAADCTGHGVPGAFMSMIGVNNLNQIVLENGVTSPNLILTELNVAIKKALKQEDEDSESQDGMDISISCFDLDKNIISYSGAFRPLIYIRDKKLFELKASRQPIGGSAPIDFQYELNEFEFKKGDVFYMFSDGYPDQFGGPKGKKFMNKRLKDVFMTIYDNQPQSQRETLKEELIKWMGDNEQIDDILVMCIKI